MSAKAGFVVADRTRIEEILDRMARRIHAELGAEVEVVGILRRGAPLARALGSRLAELGGRELEVGELRLKRYADDLSVIHDEPGTCTWPPSAPAVRTKCRCAPITWECASTSARIRWSRSTRRRTKRKVRS